MTFKALNTRVIPIRVLLSPKLATTLSSSTVSYAGEGGFSSERRIFFEIFLDISFSVTYLKMKGEQILCVCTVEYLVHVSLVRYSFLCSRLSVRSGYVPESFLKSDTHHHN
jgi:hypothetical protein